jgi:hypothetical protein
VDTTRQVSEIRLSSGKASGAGNSVELCRLDGNTLTEKPTRSAGVQGNTAIFPESVDFTDGRFAVRLEGPTASSLSPGDLAAVQRRSRFAGARIRISDLNEPDSAAFFWPTPEDIVETPPAWPMSRQGRTSPRRWSVTSTTFFPTTDEHQRRCGACG